MSDFVAGVRDSFDDQDDHILDLKNGMDFLNPKQDGIAVLKKIGLNKFTAKSFKHEWTQTALALRKETVSLADDTVTALDVTSAYQYQVGEILRIENEIVRVSAIADSNTLTIVRGVAGTTAAAHSSKTAMSLGSADAEGRDTYVGVSDTADRLYNYVQIFSRGVDLTNTEVMQASTEGNPLSGQLKRRYIEFMRQVAAAMFYGVRYEDSGNNRRFMGGLKQFITTNVTNVAGALTVAAIDAQIKKIVDAGGNPDMIVVGTKQKQKLDALDASLVRIGKKDAQSKTGGNPMAQTWQSGILDYELEIYVDHTILDDELWILDSTKVGLGPQAGNGVSGSVAVYETTLPGADKKSKVIRGHLTMEVEQEKAHGYLYGLT